MGETLPGKKPPLVFKLETMDRMLMLSAIVLQHLLFLIFFLKLIHFAFYPLPRIFSSPSLLLSYNFVPHYLLNAFLYSLFFYQHIVMALISFKQTLKSFYHKSPIYQRYLYNIASCWCYLLILSFVQPISLPSEIVFKIPSFIWISLTIIGLFFLLHSTLTFGGEIFNPFPISKVLTSPVLTVYEDDARSELGLKTDGLYGIVRHPMQLGGLLLFSFGYPEYTVDRVVFIVVNVMGILMGVYFE